MSASQFELVVCLVVGVMAGLAIGWVVMEASETIFQTGAEKHWDDQQGLARRLLRL